MSSATESATSAGKEIVKKLIGGAGTIRMRLLPSIENSDTVRLRADALSIDADGQLGEILRAGAFGDPSGEAQLTALQVSDPTNQLKVKDR